jgi:hypothetical protein
MILGECRRGLPKPTFDERVAGFDPERYWRGPIC